ncbi:hypothetical protein CBS147332_1152 [Penicillium roqueforti]|nr:hypothetical protein CBS147332_1152 [Penicillium roqueforti]KAI3122713.1 hypothetical protein CBS147331_1163 [Penicillium roqueforti]
MEKVDNYQSISRNDNTVRILRAFDNHLPADGRANFIRHLQSLQTNQDIHDHAESLVNGLLAPMKTLRSTPSISPRAGMEDSIENIALQSSEPDTTTPGAITECAHIVPFSLATWRDQPEPHAKNIIWTNLIRHFPALETRISFSRDNINDTMNAMTMTHDLHFYFGRFYFAFEETQVPNKYRLQVYRPNVFSPPLPRTVKFVSHNPRYALPSPELLNFHAAVARIFHASGAADHIDKAFRDLGETSVLAKDGSTDVSAMLAVTSLGVLGSRTGNIQQTPATFSGPKAQSVSKVHSGLIEEEGTDEEYTVWY